MDPQAEHSPAIADFGSDMDIAAYVASLTLEDRWNTLRHVLQTVAPQLDAVEIVARLRLRLQEQSSGGDGGFGAVAAVADLEKQTFHAAGGGGVTECAICLNDFEDGEEVSVMPCFHGHGFHPDCITKWLGRSNKCPLCRHELPTGVDGE